MNTAHLQPSLMRLPLDEALGLLRAAGLRPQVPSPLADLAVEPVDPTAGTRLALANAGWIAGTDHPVLTTSGRAVLERIAAPGRRVDLVLGTGSWCFTWTGLSGIERDAPALACAPLADGDGLALSAPHPPTQATDLLTAHLRVGRITDPPPFEAEFSDCAAAAWLGVLDDRLEAHLRAALDRTPVTRVAFGVDDVLDMFAEGRTSAHLGWQVPVTSVLWPELDPSPAADAVRRGLDELVGHGLLTELDGEHHELTDLGRTITEGLVPVTRWAGLTLSTRTDGSLGVERLAVRRGTGITLVERRSLTGGTTQVRSVGDADLELLLATFGTLTTAGPPAVAVPPGRCRQCGSGLHPGARFCHACGQAQEHEVRS